MHFYEQLWSLLRNLPHLHLRGEGQETAAVPLVPQGFQDAGEGEDREVPRGGLRRRQGVLRTEAVDGEGAGGEIFQELEEMKHFYIIIKIYEC